MDNQELKILLQKYREENMDEKEFRILREQINKHTDETLQKTFKGLWEEFEEEHPLSDKKKNKLYPHITSSKKLSWKDRLQNHWIRAAASLLILLTAGWALSLYRENQQAQWLAEQNVVIDSGDSPSSIVLPDGTSVKLNSRSSLSYCSDFGIKDRKIHLSGEGYFEVKHDKKKRFVVETDHMDITVLGTKFNVYAYDNRDFLEMTLVEGSVQINTTQPPYRCLTVKPKEKVIYHKANNELTLETANSGMETSWLNKELVFRHDTLKYVFDCLERKYGVAFHIADPHLLNDVYTGSFNEKEITDVLEILKMHYRFDYTKENSEIYLETKAKS